MAYQTASKYVGQGDGDVSWDCTALNSACFAPPPMGS